MGDLPDIGAEERVAGARGEVLRGGVANAGAVVRDGSQVRRPARPSTEDVHRLLRHVRGRGFLGVPEPLGVSGGVERLVYIPGEVPVPPFPDWWKHDAVLASTAALLRKFHDATAGFVTSDDTRWSMELADPEAGDVLCHNDVCPENVVYRNGEAVALLDFDFVAPGRRVYDLAQFAKMCCPMDNEDAAARLGLGDLDPFHRLRVVADSYGLPPGRESLVEAVAVAVDVGDRFVQRHVRAGEPGFVAMWKATGGQQRMDRRRQWLAENHQRLIEAVG